MGLIKEILWVWNGAGLKTYGGIKYAPNGVPDISADDMPSVLNDAGTDFSKLEIGEAVGISGHIGAHIGNGRVIQFATALKKASGLRHISILKP